MATRSTRLWGPVRVGPVAAVLVGPIPDTLIIKNVRIVATVGDPVPTRVLYGVGGTEPAQLVGDVLLEDAPRVWTDGTWLILEPGETLVMRSTAGEITTSGHGTQLTGGGEFP